MGWIVKIALGFLPGGGILSMIMNMPKWVWLAAGLILLTVYIRHDARQSERVLCNAEALGAEVQELKRQQLATEKVAGEAQTRAERSSGQNAELEQRIRDYEVQLADAPGCSLSRDDFGRLPSRQK